MPWMTSTAEGLAVAQHELALVSVVESASWERKILAASEVNNPPPTRLRSCSIITPVARGTGLRVPRVAASNRQLTANGVEATAALGRASRRRARR